MPKYTVVLTWKNDGFSLLQTIHDTIEDAEKFCKKCNSHIEEIKASKKYIYEVQAI